MDVVASSSAPSQGTLTASWTTADPGSFTLCGYLEHSGYLDPFGPSPALLSTAPVALDVRSATASVALAAPPRVDAAQKLGLTVAVTAELRRHLIVTVEPQDGRGCASSSSLADAGSTAVADVAVQGAESLPVALTASATPGRYLLCAYVQESSGDLAPEATAQAVFLVGPDPCATARTALAKATATARSVKAAAGRARAAWKRAARAAAGASGSARRAKRAQAHRAHARYLVTARRRDKAQATLVKARKAATRACGR